jgi:hypothetical protein
LCLLDQCCEKPTSQRDLCAPAGPMQNPDK